MMRVGTALKGLLKLSALSLALLVMVQHLLTSHKQRSRESVHSAVKVDVASQEESSLISIISSQLRSPVTPVAYNLSSEPSLVPDLNRDMAQLALTLSHQKDVCGSEERRCFYVEYGANDGEWFSHSLIFEVSQQWEGLLIEPSAELFQQLTHKGRRASAINACLSINSNGVEKQTFYQGSGFARFSFRPDELQEMSQTEMQHQLGPHLTPTQVSCYPLYSILHTLNRKRIDALALDADGREFSILQTLPWSKLDIRMLLLTRFWTEQQGQMQALKTFLASKKLFFLQNLAHLAIFVHTSSSSDTANIYT